MLKSTVCVLALAASLPFTTAAAAAEERVVQREVVRYDDLNLASPAGVAALERRISSAARRVCGYRDTLGASRIVSRDLSDCMTDALASARQQVAVKTGTTIRKG